MGERGEDRYERYCLVCGHSLGPLGRICDRCGSIRRPAKIIQDDIEPARFSSCGRCGEKIAFGNAYCGQCAEHVKVHAREQHESEATASFFKRFFRAIRRLFSRGRPPSSGT
jgi:uncharacterized OB-fold protein